MFLYIHHGYLKSVFKTKGPRRFETIFKEDNKEQGIGPFSFKSYHTATEVKTTRSLHRDRHKDK
jgi:hypothetical protein